MKNSDESISLRFDGAAAKQLRELTKILGVSTPGEVITQALTILRYSIGGKIIIERGKEVLKFEQFSDKEKLPDNND